MKLVNAYYGTSGGVIHDVVLGISRVKFIIFIVCLIVSPENITVDNKK